MIIVVVIVIPIVNTFIHAKMEFRNKYDFIISKIEITPTQRMSLYNEKGENIDFWSYIIMSYEDVKVGDYIYKDRCSRFLYVFKRNAFGKYEQHQKIAPTGMFPYEWFCKY